MKPDSYKIFPFGPPKMRPIIQNVFKTVTSLLQSEWQNKKQNLYAKKMEQRIRAIPLTFEDSNRMIKFKNCADSNSTLQCKIQHNFWSKKKNEQLVIRGYQIMNHFRAGSRSPGSVKELSILNVSENLDLDPPL